MQTAEGRREFLLERNAIGGSTGAMILGASKYGTAADAYDEIVAAMDGTVVVEEPTPDQQRGNVLEPVAAQMYHERTGRRIRRQTKRRLHPERPHVMAHIDRQILRDSQGNGSTRGTGVLEIKCPRHHVLARAKREGLPESYVVQLQHYLYVFGYEWGSYGIFNAEGMELVHFDMERDDELIHDVMLPAYDRFWDEHVIPRMRPEEPIVDDFDVPDLAPGEMTVIEGEEWEQALTDLEEAYELTKAAGEIKQTAIAAVKEIMSSFNAQVSEGGTTRVYWKPSKPGKMMDSKRLKKFLAGHGMTIADFQKEKKASRPFKPYFGVRS